MVASHSSVAAAAPGAPRALDGLKALPSVDRLLGHADAAGLLSAHGHRTLVAALRGVLAEVRERAAAEPGALIPSDASLLASCADRLAAAARAHGCARCST